MLKTLISLSFIIAFTCNLVQADGRLIPKAQFDKIINMQYRVKIVGDALVGERMDGKNHNEITTYRPTVISLITSPFTIDYSESDFIISAVFTPIHAQARSIYDLQSNGSPVQNWQDPVTPSNIHAVYMTADYNDPSFAYRRSKYFFSSDRGITWSYITEVPYNIRSGFVTVTGMSDGNILVANHTDAGGPAFTHTQIFADIFPGLGSFQRLDPGTGGHSPEPIWPRIASTSSITNTNKFVVLSATQGDSSFYNIGTSLIQPGTFLGWTFYKGTSAENYAVARGADGIIGIAYVMNDALYPAEDGNLYFMESTNNGSSFSTPLKIFDADFSATGDSLGAMRAVSLVYKNNSPKVAFSIIRQNPTAGTYYPLFPNKCMFWSNTLPGSDPTKSIVVADQNNVWMPQDSLYQGVNDVFAPFDRPTIGVSANNNALFYSLMVITNRFGAPVDTTNYRAQYLTASGNGGLTWKTPVRITPTTPVMDWTYASMTPVSDMDSNYYYVNMTIQKDTIPGSFVQGAINGPSLAQQMFTRIIIRRDSLITGNENLSGETPVNYNLYQNYPNPFNPVTNIRFDIPSSSQVKLIIYDALGRKVASLLNEKLSAGNYEVEWSGIGYSSGVYIYRVTTNEFSDVKKMVLIK